MNLYLKTQTEKEINIKWLYINLSKILISYKDLLSNCLKYRKKAESKNPEFPIKRRRRTLSSKSTLCARKKLRFIKEQEASVILFGLLRVKSPFEGIPSLGNINYWYKMNKIYEQV